jgi:hypothetical protein
VVENTLKIEIKCIKTKIAFSGFSRKLGHYFALAFLTAFLKVDFGVMSINKLLNFIYTKSLLL